MFTRYLGGAVSGKIIMSILKSPPPWLNIDKSFSKGGSFGFELGAHGGRLIS